MKLRKYQILQTALAEYLTGVVHKKINLLNKFPEDLEILSISSQENLLNVIVSSDTYNQMNGYSSLPRMDIILETLGDLPRSSLSVGREYVLARKKTIRPYLLSYDDLRDSFIALQNNDFKVEHSFPTDARFCDWMSVDHYGERWMTVYVYSTTYRPLDPDSSLSAQRCPFKVT